MLVELFTELKKLALFSIVPVITADMDTLYYQHGTDKTAFGTIKIVDVTVETIKTTDFLGKATYTSPNNVVFTNGLKVIFDSTVNDIEYRNKSFYVEGVGSKIHLVDINLTTSEIDLTNKDYITVTTWIRR